MTIKTIKSWMSGCPAATPSAPDLRGFWHKDDSGLVYVCAACSSRLHGRGISLYPAEPVWIDAPEPYGICAGCGK